ncbi:universal stress protein [Actimicrobium sp. CCC2.4]|uniref:universal stress protein n=1 Tax=Actimicrobium sp. CCC2.4 TaxID=3048606 RepID=UPI002AC95265|nr:universal stress protein [Actimicrobium sp. CCC2.4]MEB0136695.1 universal stress protein [Actimicrobium sp. CCC2.4]WPX33160.1 universal stress protein [Actimicrobium sp. CCC2.4]
MTYSTLMVQLELGQPNTDVLRITADLARRFDAAVIGIAACQPMQMVVGDGYICGDLIAENDQLVVAELDAAEQQFRTAMAGCSGALSWQGNLSCSSIADYIARAARAADLIVAGTAPDAPADVQRRLSLDDLVMQSGRPLLVVPPGATLLQRVLVGWTDTRETRRAIVDALPVLKMASQVEVVELGKAGDQDTARARLDDVCGWLRRHGVECTTVATLSNGDDARQLQDIAAAQHSDVIVAGAFGHSRLLEWVLGGMTRSLLAPVGRCSLLSH